MPKTAKKPTTVLIALMNEYHLNPFSLSKAIKLSPSAVRLLVIGKSKITVPTALRLAKVFGKTPAFWLDLQKDADLYEASKDRKLQIILKSISKAQKGKAKAAAKPKAKSKVKAKAKPKTKVKAKPGAKLSKKITLRDKRKQAAKKPGAKPASRKQKKSR